MKRLIIMPLVKTSWLKICIETYSGNGRYGKIHLENTPIITVWQFHEIYSVLTSSEDVEMKAIKKCQFVVGCAVYLMRGVINRQT